jgi:phosphoglucosamine mutase
MRKLFGTDGVRGIANKDLTCDLAYKIGRAATYVLTKDKKNPQIVIGKDTRISGDMLEAALIAGICSVGSNVLELGVVPTPAVAILTRIHKADAGIVISASHNPVEYNGIKLFNNKGLKLADEIELEIEKYILEEELNYFPTGSKVGKRILVKNAIKEYIHYVGKTFDSEFDGFKVALDCGNGANSVAAPMLLRERGADVELIHSNPDGLNINVNCGSTHPEMVKELVLKTGANVGFSFDGDADRIIAVDEKGVIVDGDKIMTICAQYMKNIGKLKNNTVVATVMSNLGMDICLKKNDIDLIKTKVGDRYVLEEMLKGDYILGGEQSGHIIFLEHNTTGDGLLTAVQILNIMKKTNKSLSVLASEMKILPQVLINAKVENKYKNTYMDDLEVKSAIEKVEKSFETEGRVLIRPSGTEPLVRVMIEGSNFDKIKNDAQQLVDLIESKFASK